jgi:hypothetical protein
MPGDDIADHRKLSLPYCMISANRIVYCRAEGGAVAFLDLLGSGFHEVRALTSSTQPFSSHRRSVWMNLQPHVLDWRLSYTLGYKLQTTPSASKWRSAAEMSGGDEGEGGLTA